MVQYYYNIYNVNYCDHILGLTKKLVLDKLNKCINFCLKIIIIKVSKILYYDVKPSKIYLYSGL